MNKFDKHSLAEFDGSKGDGHVYIGRAGKVYDVSTSKLWKTGVHMNRHKAGRDLTADFSAAPHGEEVFERFPQIGTLTETPEAVHQQLPSWLVRFLQRNVVFRSHPHPMLVHFPIVFMFATPSFILLALATGNRTFETTALHCLGAGLIFTPLAMATGFLTWWMNYLGRPIRAVHIKIWTSFLLLVDAAIVFSWRLLTPDILIQHSPGTYYYIFLVCALIPLVGIIGWFGAQLTFPMNHEKEKDAA